MARSIDVGTYNLIAAKRTAEDKIEYTKEINAFIELPLENRFMFNMMKKAGVPLIERDKMAYAIGEAALNIAYSMNQLELKRPMKDGCVNPKESHAFQILSVMIHSLIGEIDHDGENLCYCVPANAVNQETDADYHQKLLKVIFDKYEVNGKRLNAFHINEALALIYAELQEKALTGIGVSWGGGMVNFCYANMAMPIVQFSVVNSGDWLDKQAAKATGESETFINKEKMKVDLLRPATSMVERAIQTQYRILIEKTMRSIKEKLIDAGTKVPRDKPVDIVLAGGTASPNGFDVWVREAIQELDFPVPIGEIRRPTDHLFAVARGTLVAAEMSS